MNQKLLAYYAWLLYILHETEEGNTSKDSLPMFGYNSIPATALSWIFPRFRKYFASNVNETSGTLRK